MYKITKEKKLLMKFCRFLVSNKKELGSNSVNKWIIDDFINSLNQTEPEPLTNNKQSQEFCKCKEERTYSLRHGLGWICNKCRLVTQNR